LSHKEQRDFCINVKKIFPQFFKNTKILDIGSLDINGNNKIYFSNSEYIGIDLNNGKNVDIVCRAHEYPIPEKKFDVVISTECFEHDMHLSKTIPHIIKLLKVGGLFIFTCATTGRKEHGTRNSSKHDSPFTYEMKDGWEEYYKNVTEEMIKNIINVELVFSKYKFSTIKKRGDLQFWGVKK